MVNNNKLKGKIVEKELTYENCAKALGISKNSFSSKINNKTESGFGIVEAKELSDLLDLSNDEKLSIFFT